MALKRGINYETLSDDLISMAIGRDLDLAPVDINPQDVPYKESGYKYKPYAISLDACREAIEKFSKRIDCRFELQFDASEYEWTILNIMPFFHKKVVKVKHKNPARAACVAMLKAMEKDH